MLNHTGFSVHGHRSPDRTAAKSFIHALHAKTYAKDGNFIEKILDQIN